MRHWRSRPRDAETGRYLSDEEIEHRGLMPPGWFPLTWVAVGLALGLGFIVGAFFVEWLYDQLYMALGPAPMEQMHLWPPAPMEGK